MARPTTTAQAAALLAPRRLEFVRLRIEDPDGAMGDLSAYFVSADLDTDDLDAPVGQATLRLRRDAGPTLSLSPTRTDSLLNRDAANTYAPRLDAGRAVTVDVAVLDPAVATTPATGDWQRMFEGTVDFVDPASALLVLVARDAGARLQDTWLEQDTAMVVSTDPPVAMETLIQLMLNTALGIDEVTLYTPVSPGSLITSFGYHREPVFEAIQRLAMSIGWDCRYRWDATTSTSRLTLYEPPRGKTAPDATFGPKQYLSLSKFAISRVPVRNWIKVFYTDPSTGLRSDVLVSDAASIARFKQVRPLIIEEATDSAINSAAEALVLANALLADLKDPRADAEAVLPLYWPAELHDLARFTDNVVHFNSNQDLAAVTVRHTLVTSGMSTTTLTLRGSPSGGYRAWFRRGDPGAPPRILPPTVRVRLDDATDTQASYLIEGGPGAGAPPLPFEWRTRRTVNGTVGAWSAWAAVSFPQSLTILRNPLYPVDLEIEVIQADGQTAGTVLTASNTNIVTPSLVVVPSAPYATSQEFTVSASNPAAGAAPTLVVRTTGTTFNYGGVSHAAETDIAIASGGVIAVDRPVFDVVTQAAVTITASLAGGGSETIQRTIPNQVQTTFGPSLDVKPTPGDASYSLAYTGTWDTLLLSIDGLPYSTPAASPITVTRTSHDQTYTFQAVKDGQTIVVAVTIPALASAGAGTGQFASLSQSANFTANTMTYAWVYTGPTADIILWVNDFANGWVQESPNATSPYVYATRLDISLSSPNGLIEWYLEAAVGDTIVAPSVQKSYATHGV